MIFIKKVLINNWKKNTETSDMNSGLIFTKFVTITQYLLVLMIIIKIKLNLEMLLPVNVEDERYRYTKSNGICICTPHLALRVLYPEYIT